VGCADARLPRLRHTCAASSSASASWSRSMAVSANARSRVTPSAPVLNAWITIPIRAVRRYSARASRPVAHRPTEDGHLHCEGRCMTTAQSIDVSHDSSSGLRARPRERRSSRPAFGQAKSYALSTTDGLRLHNTTAERVTFRTGRRSDRRVTRRHAPAEYLAGTMEPEAFVRIEGSRSRTASSKSRLERRRGGSAQARRGSPASRSGCGPKRLWAADVRRVLSPPDERARRGSGTAQPRGAVHLAPD